MNLPNKRKACPKTNNCHFNYLCPNHSESNNVNCAMSLFDGILGDEYYVTCAGFGWRRVNFLYISWCSAVFWICAENSVDNTGMFSLPLSSAYTEPRPFLLLTPPHQRGGWVAQEVGRGHSQDS